MAAIRTVLIGVPPMLRDIVKQCVGSERDIEIVGELLAEDDKEPLRVLKPEVVIVSLARGDAEDVPNWLLETAPYAKIVALSPDNRKALCCTMQPHRTVLLDFSAQQIADFIRGADRKPIAGH